MLRMIGVTCCVVVLSHYIKLDLYDTALLIFGACLATHNDDASIRINQVITRNHNVD